MERLTATVRRVTGATDHRVLESDERGQLKAERVPGPRYVAIVKQPHGWALLRFDEEDDCVADTWHPTLEDAKKQAQFEYEIEEGDWVADQ
jgi:hypothetical protein